MMNEEIFYKCKDKRSYHVILKLCWLSSAIKLCLVPQNLDKQTLQAKPASAANPASAQVDYKLTFTCHGFTYHFPLASIFSTITIL